MNRDECILVTFCVAAMCILGLILNRCSNKIDYAEKRADKFPTEQSERFMEEIETVLEVWDAFDLPVNRHCYSTRTDRFVVFVWDEKDIIELWNALPGNQTMTEAHAGIVFLWDGWVFIYVRRCDDLCERRNFVWEYLHWTAVCAYGFGEEDPHGYSTVPDIVYKDSNGVYRTVLERLGI